MIDSHTIQFILLASNVLVLLLVECLLKYLSETKKVEMEIDENLIEHENVSL